MAETMSYKLDLSDLKRDGDVSITQQLVDRFAGDEASCGPLDRVVARALCHRHRVLDTGGVDPAALA